MNERPHSNSTFRSRLVTKGERHRRRSQLRMKIRATKAKAEGKAKLSQLNLWMALFASTVVLVWAAWVFLT